MKGPTRLFCRPHDDDMMFTFSISVEMINDAFDPEAL